MQRVARASSDRYDRSESDGAEPGCLARALRLCEIGPVPQLVPCTLADAVGSDFDFEIYPAW